MRNKQTPGGVLKTLLDKNDLNCNRLAKAINMSNAMVRLLLLDKSPISLTAALRLAKFFKTKPEFWLNLQMKYDLEKAAASKSIARELAGITTVNNYSFERKPHTKRKKAAAGKRKVAKKAVKKAPRAKKPATRRVKTARRGRRAKK